MISSEYLGDSETGRPIFDNQRSEMGEFIYQLKYKQDRRVLPKIIALLDRIKGIEKFDFLVPIPPTNKMRPFQPVQLITEALGKKRDVIVLDDVLHNNGKEELKGVTDPLARDELLKEALTLHDKARIKGKAVLLVDDLYRSGSTLNIATDILLDEGGADRVSVLTMTKTRSNR